jgi:2-polyprenyl-3-methyl-5-hydroxy-6-metoxy-1,4-benzoquinol methylase
MDLPVKICPVCLKQQKIAFEYQGFRYYRCITCGMVSTYPFPDSAALDLHYAKKFKKGNYQLLQSYVQPYNRVYNDFIDILDLVLGRDNKKFNGLKVLDVGCFTGVFLELLKNQKNADVYGVELQSEAVAIANQKLPGRIFKTDILAGDFPDTKFDVITLLGVVEHVVDPISLFKRSCGFLNPGGVLMIQTPNAGSLFARLLGKWWPPYAPVEHIHYFTKKSLIFTLRNLGFEIVYFKPHWKKLPVSYVFQMFQNFGPEFYRLFKPFYDILPACITDMVLPFYAGEMIVVAKKPDKI